MGFTALDRLFMGSRCGTLGPSVILYMLQQKKMRPDELEQLLYERSGRLGVSGISSDMRVPPTSTDPRAHGAVELLVFRAAPEPRTLVASLGGLDGFVFTAGIGEHAADVRASIYKRLPWFGLLLDPGANARHVSRINTPAGRRRSPG